MVKIIKNLTLEDLENDHKKRNDKVDKVLLKISILDQKIAKLQEQKKKLDSSISAERAWGIPGLNGKISTMKQYNAKYCQIYTEDEEYSCYVRYIDWNGKIIEVH